MAQTPQNFANHVRWDPPVHYFIFPVFAITFVIAIVHLVQRPSLLSAWFVVLAAAAVGAILKMRLYALKVQDRVIRLEERLRLAALVDDGFRGRILELSEGQLVGLRFASDSEIAGLAQRALAEKLGNQDIKKSVQTWRADNWRV